MNFGRVFAVFKKEMRRFFTDKRMLAALFLPGIIIFLFYSFLGNALTSLFDGSSIPETYSYKVAINEEEEGGKFVPILESYFSSSGQQAPTITYYEASTLEEMKDELKGGELDSLLFFGFEDGELSKVEAYYNGESEASEALYSALPSLIDLAYKTYTFNDGIEPNLGGSSFTEVSILGFILPMITISLLYSSVIAVCPESIAGE